jgi:rod shape determining protein RodA
MKIDRRLLLNFDWPLLALMFSLCSIGLISIYSTGFSLAGTVQIPLYVKQLQWIGLGLVFMVLAFSIDYRLINRFAYPIYFISVALLIAVVLFGHETRGSQRWITLGSFTFQPSELMKLAMILALARYFDRHHPRRAYGIRELWFPGLMVLLPFFLILKQPDLGTAIVIGVLMLSFVLFLGMDKRLLAWAAGIMAISAPLVWQFLKDYQRERIITLFSPERDPLGSGYHILQSMIAVGSGGILGKGFLQGTQTQLKFLPEQQTDFVFSVFAEEWGFFGVLILLLIFFALILWAMNVAARARDFLGMMIAYGIAILILTELFINIGMVIGILPVVGIPLPFLSYGGSSVVMLMTATGLLMNISMRRFILDR